MNARALPLDPIQDPIFVPKSYSSSDRFFFDLSKTSGIHLIVFDDLDFLKGFCCLMHKQYDVLTRQAININNAFRDETRFFEPARSESWLLSQ